MVVRWMVSMCTAFFLLSAVCGQSYPGYYIDRDGVKNNAVFLIRPALFSRQPDLGSIATGVVCIENGREFRLSPGMCQGIYFNKGQERIEFLSLPNLIGNEYYDCDSLFLRPKIIGHASLYYYYFFSHAPVLNIKDDGTVCPRKPGPLSIAKQGWIIAKEDGTTIKITHRGNKKYLSEFFHDHSSLAGTIRTGEAKGNVSNAEALVVSYNSWKVDQESLRANLKK